MGWADIKQRQLHIAEMQIHLVFERDLWNGGDAVFSEYHSNFQSTGSFMLRVGRWKYIAYAGYESQLFDLESDPDEVSNLVDSSPEAASGMDRRLRSIIDYEAVDARAKAYDRESFRQWRQDIDDEEYRRLMAENFPLWQDGDLKKVDDLISSG